MHKRAALFLTCGLLTACASPPPDETRGDTATMAVAWKQTAAEYEALYYQGFALARLRVEQALAVRKSASAAASARPLAVVADLDDTVLDTRSYWRELLTSGRDFFDDATWDAWVAAGKVTASPGAKEFIEFCRSQNVAVFYITSRDQGADTETLARRHIEIAGLPLEADRLTVLTGSSDKEVRQRDIARDFDIVVLLGDNLNDFRRRYYVTDVDERRRLLAGDRDEFGRRFIVFPNPTDGHWVRAIFGDSEPPASIAARERLKRAATGR